MQGQMYERFEKLKISPGHGMIPTEILKFEELDTEITTAMAQAERKCRKLRMGEVKWSPLYQKSCDKVKYWTLVQKSANGDRINTRKLIALRNKLGLPRATYDTAHINRQLMEAIKNRQKCKKYAPELQMEYRYRLAKAMEEENKVAAVTHIRNFTHQENILKLF
jgi:hypothetical protein